MENEFNELANYDEYAVDAAASHVDWLLEFMRKPMVEEFYHGFKHGVEWERDRKNKEDLKNVDHGA